MNLAAFPAASLAIPAAADCLIRWLTAPKTRNLMVAAGNTPLPLYAEVARRRLNLSRLNVFALDEYVGVPPSEPRNCANLLRSSVAEAWAIPPSQFFPIHSAEPEALPSAMAQEARITAAGGLDAIVLGLGQNGHLGFNEPGSLPDSLARLLDLEPISIEANRAWFRGAYAPAKGVTVGLKTILAAKRVLLLAFGSHKKNAARAMIHGPITPACPASFLQEHPECHVFLDASAAPE